MGGPVLQGLFRTYKRTLKKLKLSSRTVKLIHRELEGSLLALQILLAHVDLALRPRGAAGQIVISPRKVLIDNPSRDQPRQRGHSSYPVLSA